MAARVHIRIEPKLKQEVNAIFARLGLTEGDAIRIFYNQVKLHNGLPFTVRIPSQETVGAAAEVEAAESTVSYENGEESRQELALAESTPDIEIGGVVYKTRNGIPLLPIQPGAGVATLELINELRDEAP